MLVRLAAQLQRGRIQRDQSLERLAAMADVFDGSSSQPDATPSSAGEPSTSLWEGEPATATSRQEEQRRHGGYARARAIRDALADMRLDAGGAVPAAAAAMAAGPCHTRRLGDPVPPPQMLAALVSAICRERQAVRQRDRAQRQIV